MTVPGYQSRPKREENPVRGTKQGTMRNLNCQGILTKVSFQDEGTIQSISSLWRERRKVSPLSDPVFVLSLSMFRQEIKD